MHSIEGRAAIGHDKLQHRGAAPGRVICLECIIREDRASFLPILGLWVGSSNSCDEMRSTRSGCPLASRKNRKSRDTPFKKWETSQAGESSLMNLIVEHGAVAAPQR